MNLPALWLLILSRSLVTMGGQMTEIYLASFFAFRGYGEFQAGIIIGIVGFVSIGGRPLIGAISDRWGREAAFTLGAGMHIGGLLVALLFVDGVSLWPLICFVALAGLSDGFSGLLIGTKAADIFPTNSLGTAMGIVDMGRGVGIALGPVLGGWLLDWRGDYTTTFSLATILFLVSICTMWLTNLKRPAFPPLPPY